MAGSEKALHPERIAIGSHQTALCIIPRADLCQDINRLRALYDNAYGKWPAHINVVYPFVAIESLPQAVELIRSKLVNLGQESGHRSLHVRLEKSDHFSHRNSDTIYIAPADSENERLEHLRSTILGVFEQNNESYRPHLTIGQTRVGDNSSREHLSAKASLLLPIEWQVEQLFVLVRERTYEQDTASVQMKIWGTLDLSNSTRFDTVKSLEFPEKPQTEEEWSDEEEKRTVNGLSTGMHPLLQGLQITTDHSDSRNIPTTQPWSTYQFSIAHGIWEPVRSSNVVLNSEQMPSALTISTYNVLVDSVYPPVRDRYALLIRTLLSKPALADILVLQEVSDDFLSHLLGHGTFRSRYPFTTHGPPDQPGIGPLASLRNIVVLSRWRFSWDWVPFERRHKGAVVLRFETIGKCNDSAFLPLVVAGLHLTCGLTDGSVSSKKSQLQTLMNHLSKQYPEHPWVIAGDFNVTTSAFTISAALKNRSISSQTASTLFSLETMLSEAGLSDSWYVARAEMGEAFMPAQNQAGVEDLYEGEQGATFDVTANPLAAETAGRGLSNRPQRYDRILFKEEDFLKVQGFNMFGLPGENDSGTDDCGIRHRDAELQCGSDHWGIRSTLKIDPNSAAREPDATDVQLAPLRLRKSSLNLSDMAALKSYLAEQSMFPTDEEIKKRKEVFALVKSTLQQNPSQRSGDTDGDNRPNIPMVVVPVGSYGLGVWSTSSDIDVLCIGSISGKTFFALAGQRLRKAAHLGFRILRKVKANSGTMLELDVRGIKLDLQYCPATRIAERWPEATQLPPSDPSFDLSILSLTKLKSFRDADYLQRTIPDLAVFRIAHRFIRAWAKQRGIYSAKFGYLGGFHITLMLSRICKLLFRYAGAVTAPDIICTFFNHYANFDWKTQMVFDPFFYKQQPRYHRSAREPMVILGLHAPSINAAQTASFPSLKTLVGELKRADDLLSEDGITWSRLVGSTEEERAMADLPSSAHEFLQSYNTYIKINVQYWGLSLAKGSTLVGRLESKCVLLLVDINRKLENIHARIWPARFTLNHDEGQDEKDYQGCYLIGLRKGEDVEAQPMTEADRKLAQGALRTILERFADQIRSDERHFDATSSWMDVTQVKRCELGDLKLDDREWGNHVIEEDESDTEDEDEDIIIGSDDAHDDEAAAAASAKPKHQSAGKTTSKAGATKKLRPATDILNRLRWDPNLDSSDHVVGYEDRFLGTREIALDRWKTEQTDEEFIPQHRIMYFRRRSDGVVVWERETRRDEIFGSGVGRAL